MAKYKVIDKTFDYSENITIQPEDYGGWLAVNTGTANVSVNGFELEPGDGIDFTHIAPEVIWNKQIVILILASGGKVRLTRLKYTEVK